MKTGRILSTALVAVVFLVGTCGAEEEVFLKTGEQYRCEIKAIEGGALTCRVGEEERV